MKGHSLPGINQRSKSPAKHPHLSKANHSLRSHVDNFKRGFSDSWDERSKAIDNFKRGFSDQASKPIKENLPFVGKSPSKQLVEPDPTGKPLKMKSPLQQGVLTCPECGMQIEDSEGGGEAMMQHIMDDHFGGSTGGGTPGYINIHNPGGWEPGDPVGPAATKEDKTPRLNTPN